MPAPAPPTRAEAVSDLEIAAIRPRPLVLARTTWFFAVYVVTGAFRWLIERLSHGRAWLATQWRHASIRAGLT